jgi:hypothetical protein
MAFSIYETKQKTMLNFEKHDIITQISREFSSLI